jgi:3-hydroxyisobutyrate dehydrogenase-like beta-hydroxyacid dehydrogenase
MANIGFVGLGVMGSGMVERLLAADHIVIGYNRTKSKAQRLLDQGMKWADTPCAVARAGDLVISMPLPAVRRAYWRDCLAARSILI